MNAALLGRLTVERETGFLDFTGAGPSGCFQGEGKFDDRKHLRDLVCDANCRLALSCGAVQSEIRVKAPLLALCLSFGATGVALADKMVSIPIPNGDCSDPSLTGFRFRYDVEPVKLDQYVENHKWIKAGVIAGRKCVMIQAPSSVLQIQTAKVETAFLPIQPGATYKFVVDYYLDGTGTKMWAETCVVDPGPEAVREEEEAKGKRTTIFRFKPFRSLPALLMIHRAAAPELGKEEPQNWYSAEREFTTPAEWSVTLPFTIRGDGVASTFPVKADSKDDDSAFEIVEVRLRTVDQKLPYRQNKSQDYTVNEGRKRNEGRPHAGP